MSDRAPEVTENMIKASTLANEHLGDVKDKKPGIFGWFQKKIHRLSTDKGSEILNQYERSADYDVDELTGLPNRRRFGTELESAISEFERNNIPFSIVNVDLLEFKKINDTYGHQSGDEALKYFSDFLRVHKRPSDEAFRVGGDEFLMILRGSNQEDGDHFLARLKSEMDKARNELLPDQVVEKMVDINKSVKEWKSGDTYKDFMDDLDRKMYAEKRNSI